MQRMKQAVSRTTVDAKKDRIRHIIARAVSLFMEDADTGAMDQPGHYMRDHAGQFTVALTPIDDMHSRLLILGKPRPGAPLCRLFSADLAAGGEVCDVQDFNRSQSWQRAFVQGDA